MENPYRIREARVKKRVKIIAVADSPMDIVNPATGEVRRATPYVGNRRFRDVQEFTKFFRSDVVYGLGVQGFRVMFYIFEIMNFDGVFSIDIDKCAERIGFSRRHVFRGLKELKDRDIIRKDIGNRYWFNPNIAFKGCRDDLLEISMASQYEEGDSHIEERRRSFFDGERGA